ncbi:hypothetical protein RF11_07184 [Thelohanellus kitauei]|uniref:Uncharacterized protein n=1 Tax=Thelohanellus kitauei TaxID=669202 RepID=A0A0C2N3L6_THEKT|nr:hypothetical protein RF11_07184 [Thelohanellus kitauei]
MKVSPKRYPAERKRVLVIPMKSWMNGFVASCLSLSALKLSDLRFMMFTVVSVMAGDRISSLLSHRLPPRSPSANFQSMHQPAYLRCLFKIPNGYCTNSKKTCISCCHEVLVFKANSEFSYRRINIRHGAE